VKLTDIAARLDCVLKGSGDAEIAAVAGIDEAKPGISRLSRIQSMPQKLEPHRQAL
jgi:hypothetical protein